MGVLERERKKGSERTFEELMAKNFQNLLEYTVHEYKQLGSSAKTLKLVEVKQTYTKTLQLNC